jgi:hypothetical protein
MKVVYSDNYLPPRGRGSAVMLAAMVRAPAPTRYLPL